MREREAEGKNLYQLRLAKEQSIPETDIQARMRWDLPIISENMKCSISLDLPILNCKPTEACGEVCYACQGRQFYRRAVVKSVAVNRLIAEDPEHVAQKMVDEASGRVIRLAGSGELLPTQKTLVDYLEKLGGSWWGFTRRVDTHQALPALMFSLDATTPTSVLKYVEENVPVSRRAYLVRPKDPAPSLEVAVTFPVHGARTPSVKKVPVYSTDCPAARKAVEGCWRCRRCY